MTKTRSQLHRERARWKAADTVIVPDYRPNPNVTDEADVAKHLCDFTANLGGSTLVEDLRDQIHRQRMDYAMRTGILPGLHCGGVEIEPARRFRHPASVYVWERQGERMFAHVTTALLRDKRFPHRLRFRWSHEWQAWFFLRTDPESTP